MRSTSLRRATMVLVTGLTAALLPLVAAAPAHADPDCLSEVYDQPLLLTGCDDTVPPQTTISAVAPVPNPLRFVRATTVSFAFSGEQESGDTGTVGFECMLYNSATAPAESDAGNWESCTSPKTYADLAQTGSTAYTFKVRAIDVTDRNIIAFDGNPVPAPTPDADQPDHDLSPATTTVRIDTVAPNTFLTRTPTDDLRPDWPVTLTTSPQVTLNTSEAATFKCEINGKSYPCHAGVNTLRNLPGGDKTFVARAVDRAGNVDPSASTTKFWVPQNIKKTGKSWKRVESAGYFGNDYLTADKVGATLKIKGQRGVEEVRLLAPSGPRSGKIEVRVGNGQWYTVDLRSKKSVRQKMFLVRDEYTTTQNGSIEIRVKSLPRGGSVSLDAYVARR